MSLITPLVSFGLRQMIGDYADGPVQVATAIEQRFRDHSRTLPNALDHAHHRAWQALGVALAGDGFLDRVKVFFASGDDKGVRQQVQLLSRRQRPHLRRDAGRLPPRLPGRTPTPPQVRLAVHARNSTHGHRSPSGRLPTPRRPARIGRRGAAGRERRRRRAGRKLPEPGPPAAHADADWSAVAGGGLLLFLPPRGRDQRRTGPRSLLRRPTATVGVPGAGVRRSRPRR